MVAAAYRRRTLARNGRSLLQRSLCAFHRYLYGPLRAVADGRLARRGFREQAPKKPRPSHLLTGERGEDAAFFYLRGRGYTLVARRWVSQRLRGDLDLVAWLGDTLVFVEVKTRVIASGYSEPFVAAEAAVDTAKQQHLRLMASAYLGQMPAPYREAVPLRFDVVSVYLGPDGTRFHHVPGAFPATEPNRIHR